MKMIHIRERGGDEVGEYKEALMMAKKSAKKMMEAMETLCDLTEEMEDEYGYGERRYSERYNNRGDYGYSQRGGYSQRDGYYRRDDDWDSMQERRSRDSRGRYM